MNQLVFKFPFKTKYYEQDFYVSSNNFSAYKLIEIENKFHFITNSKKILELGAAPGGWSQVALEINPKHVGALQYQGELFITLGQIDKAKDNLERIGKICWLFPCNEEQLLEQAIAQSVGE